jgi:adhesin transport system outer membrane protein
MCGAVHGQSLFELLQEATANHPSVRNQQAQSRAASKNLDAAQWQFYPTPSLSMEGVDAAKDDTSYKGDARVTYLRLQQPLWSGGRLTAAKDKALVNVELAQASTEDTQLQIGLRVVQAFADWHSANLKVAALQRSVETHDKLLQQARRRIEDGVSPASDLTLVQGRTDATAAELSLSALQGQQALNRLMELTGQPTLDASTLKVPATSISIWPQDMQSLTDQALANHPGIRRAWLQKRLAELQITERQSELQPDVFIRAERQWGNFAVKNASPENRIFIGINSKLGAGLSVMSNIESAAESLTAAHADVQAQERLVREQVATDFLQSQSYALRSRSLEGALESSRAVFDSFGRQFNAGKKSWLDLMTAARELANAEIQMAELAGSEMQTNWRLALLTLGLSFIQQNNR